MKKGRMAIILAIGGIVTGSIVGMIAMGKIISTGIKDKLSMSDKYFELFLLMDRWVKMKQEGKNLSSWFEKNGYNKIAIYGISNVGKDLLNELKNTGVQIVYGIDKNADRIYAGIDIVTLDDPLDEVDAIIVTAIHFFNEIAEQLCVKVDCPIISLKDILDEV